jgi:hypothetical protein
MFKFGNFCKASGFPKLQNNNLITFLKTTIYFIVKMSIKTGGFQEEKVLRISINFGKPAVFENLDFF